MSSFDIGYLSLIRYMFASIFFSCSIGPFFVLLFASFAVQKLFSLM